MKQEAISLIKKDVLAHANHSLIEETNSSLSNTQAFVRPINFFYLQKGSRNRIELTGDEYAILNTDLKFSKSQLEMEIENYPERFSPNVLLRPLYKELILPNLAMIGGGAEINYWMQLKSTFTKNGIVFPILLLRNSVMIVNRKNSGKIEQLGFKISDFFTNEDELNKSFVARKTESEVDLSSELVQLDSLYDALLLKADEKGMQSSILAEKQKQLNALKKIEQKLNKAEKQKHSISLNQISQVKSNLFPNNSLQERHDNIIPFYLKYGGEFISQLKNNLNPIEQDFSIFIQD